VVKLDRALLGHVRSAEDRLFAFCASSGQDVRGYDKSG
jgi:hypothetical protein